MGLMAGDARAHPQSQRLPERRGMPNHRQSLHHVIPIREPNAHAKSTTLTRYSPIVGDGVAPCRIRPRNLTPGENFATTSPVAENARRLVDCESRSLAEMAFRTRVRYQAPKILLCLQQDSSMDLFVWRRWGAPI